MQNSHQVMSDEKLTYNGKDVALNVVEAVHRAQIELLWKRLVKLEETCVKFERLKILDETQLGDLLQDFAEDVLNTKDSSELNELINDYVEEA